MFPSEVYITQYLFCSSRQSDTSLSLIQEPINGNLLNKRMYFNVPHYIMVNLAFLGLVVFLRRHIYYKDIDKICSHQRLYNKIV